MDILKSSFSDEEKNKALDDLSLVGESKPIGYLPITTLKDICGVEIEDMRKELEKKGLVVIILKYPQETSVASGALYTYHQKALQRLLDANRHILEKNNWPTNPEQFVRHLKVFAKDPDLFKLIMQAFADPRLKKTNIDK